MYVVTNLDAKMVIIYSNDKQMVKKYSFRFHVNSDLNFCFLFCENWVEIKDSISLDDFKNWCKKSQNAHPSRTSGFSGWGTVRKPPPPQDFDPLPIQRVPLFTIFRYSFVVIDHLAPIYTFLREGKTPFLACFFSKFCADNLAQIIWSKWSLYSDLWELRKSLWPT